MKLDRALVLYGGFHTDVGAEVMLPAATARSIGSFGRKALASGFADDFCSYPDDDASSDTCPRAAERVRRQDGLGRPTPGRSSAGYGRLRESFTTRGERGYHHHRPE